MKHRWAFLLIGLAYLSFSGFCVHNGSFVAQDGHRYFTINDDALISLRYAWNLAHGHGLVWNPGERVEGFTNPLWTLYAAAWAVVTSRRFLPLVMQLSGVAFLLAQALVFLLIARTLMQARGRTSPWREAAAFVLPLVYGPLVFWSMEGLEVCLVGFLIALAVLFYIQRKLIAVAVALGLAFWTRPDSAIPAAIIMGLAGLDVLRDRKQLKAWLTACSVLLAFGAVLFTVRQLYYGHLWPNTYVLKMRGFPAMDRIKLNGIEYIKPFLRANSLPLALAVWALVVSRTRWRFLFLALVVPMIVYVVYVGGDALQHWRFLAPYVPFLGLTFLDAAGADRPVSKYRSVPNLLMLLMVLGSWLVTSVAPIREQFRGPGPFERKNIEIAIELNRLMKPGASIGVLHAGSIPYYTDFQAYDFLGKCDWTIARLPPNLVDPPHWGGMRSVPGHNKHDLGFSISHHRPTYIQSYWWGYDCPRAYVLDHYAFTPTFIESDFTGPYLLFLRGSEFVRWDLVQPKPLLGAKIFGEKMH